MTRRPTRPGPDRRDGGPRDDDALPRTGVLFVSTPGCGACRAVRTAVARLDGAAPVPIVEVDARQRGDLAAQHHVLAAPTLIALHEGTEVGRHTGVASPEQLRDLAGAAAGGTRLRTRATPAGLTGLRLLVAVVLAVAGGITATPTLVLIGAAIGTWALVTLARTRHELRTH